MDITVVLVIGIITSIIAFLSSLTFWVLQLFTSFLFQLHRSDRSYILTSAAYGIAVTLLGLLYLLKNGVAWNIFLFYALPVLPLGLPYLYFQHLFSFSRMSYSLMDYSLTSLYILNIVSFMIWVPIYTFIIKRLLSRVKTLSTAVFLQKSIIGNYCFSLCMLAICSIIKWFYLSFSNPLKYMLLINYGATCLIGFGIIVFMYVRFFMKTERNI